MPKRIYSVYDAKACVYLQPFFANTDAEAVRMIKQVVDDSNSLLSKHPEDFNLFCVGLFDEDDGTIMPMGNSPVNIVSVLVLKSVSSANLEPNQYVAFEGKGIQDDLNTANGVSKS